MAIAGHRLDWATFVNELGQEVNGYGGLGDEWLRQFNALPSVDAKAREIHQRIESIGELTGDRNAHYHGLVRFVLRSFRADENHQLIAALRSIEHPLLTVNYDCFLEDALKRFPIDIRDLPFVPARAIRMTHEDDIRDDIDNPEPRERYSHGGATGVRHIFQRYVVHLHGTYFSQRGFCLTDEEYRATSAEVIPALFDLVMGERQFQNPRSLVFIGCAGTIQDRHFNPLFQRLVDRNREREEQLLSLEAQLKDDPGSYNLQREHANLTLKVVPVSFWLVKHDEYDECRALVARSVFQSVLRVIDYGAKYDDLPGFLQNAFTSGG